MTGKRRKGRDPVPPPAPPPPVEPSPRPEPSPQPEPLVVAPRPTRRQVRADRKRKQRRRIGIAGGSMIAVGVLIVVGVGVFVGNKVVTDHHDNPTDEQTTVLFQLQAPDGTATASALLAHDSSNGQGVEVLLPARTITDVCGYGSESFGSTLSLPGGPTASRDAVSAMLGNITVDGSWVLQPAQLAKLIDLLGGVSVNVDVDVVQPTAGGGGKVLVPAGSNRKLSGEQAVEYATYSTSARADAAVELARLQQVLDATTAALPRSATAVAALVRQLGAGGTSTLGADRLSGFLAGFGDAERVSGQLYPTDLPVTTLDGGGAPSYRVDSTQAGTLVSQRLAKSVPAGQESTRPTVELLNGVGSPGLVRTACPLLAANGLAYAGGQNAGSFNNPTSTIAVSDANIALGYRVASALHLPRSDVRRTSFDQSVADAIVTLGNDYHA
jgi:hypothetical protein